MTSAPVLAPARVVVTSPRPSSAKKRTLPGWARGLGGAAILAVLVWRLGTSPFLDAVSRIDWQPVAAAVGIAVVTTVACAWRWRLVAGGLGVGVPLRVAVAGYYRSQFLNTTLPGGVLGDVHRAVRHGRDVGDVGRSLRAVAWERSAGQAVQLVLTVVVVLLLPSPVRPLIPVAGAVVVGAALGVLLLRRVVPHREPSLWTRTMCTAAADVRDGLLARQVWPGVVVCSVLVVVGHATTFLIAARTAGSNESPVRMLPLALVVLLAMGVPVNFAGWGPREGVAAWVFGLAGLSAATGIATAVVYGVMVLVASLPGAAVLIVDWLRQHAIDPGPGPVELPRWASCPRGDHSGGVADG